MKTILNKNTDGKMEAAILIVFYVLVFCCIILAS